MKVRLANKACSRLRVVRWNDSAGGLARDADYRQRIGERIELSRHILLEDTAPIRALEDFLVQAATAANTNGGVRNGPA